jgi:hydrogenase maturation factor
MCLPRIGEIVAIDGAEAVVAMPEARTASVSLLCVPTATVGDHVMIHAGHAIDVLDPSEAAERQDMIDAVTGRGDPQAVREPDAGR